MLRWIVQFTFTTQWNSFRLHTDHIAQKRSILRRKRHILPKLRSDATDSPKKLQNQISTRKNVATFVCSIIRWRQLLSFLQRNTVSSFLDLNNIYGDLPSDLAPLRESFGGLFKMDSLNLTPSTADGTNIAGDFQFVQNTGLILIHTIFYRFHNMIARGLGVLHPAWTNDQLFYETRRIVIAVYQHIVYHDWLPVVLGRKFPCIFLASSIHSPIWNFWNDHLIEI